VKICHIGWATSPHTVRWVKWFAERGHESYLITDEGEIDGVKTYQIPQSFGIDTRPRWKRFIRLSFNDYRVQRARFKVQRYVWIRNLVRDINPEILHSHALWFPGNLGVYVRSKNFVVTVMNGDVLYHHGKDASLSHHFMVMYAMRKAKIITGVSQTLINAAQQHGAKKYKTNVIRRGVDFYLFNKNRNKEEIKRILGLKSKYAVLSPRYLGPMGNVSSLIRAAPLIIEKIRDIQFIFIFPSGGDHLGKLKALAEGLGISDKLLFIGRIAHAPHHSIRFEATCHREEQILPSADQKAFLVPLDLRLGSASILNLLDGFGCLQEWTERLRLIHDLKMAHELQGKRPWTRCQYSLDIR